MPQDPTLLNEGPLSVTLTARTAHAAYAKLWLLPPGASNWVEPPVEVADGSTEVSTKANLGNVRRGTHLGWNLSVGTNKGTTDYSVSFTLSQGGGTITSGVLVVQGTTDATGVDIDLDNVLLR